MKLSEVGTPTMPAMPNTMGAATPTTPTPAVGQQQTPQQAAALQAKQIADQKKALTAQLAAAQQAVKTAQDQVKNIQSQMAAVGRA